MGGRTEFFGPVIQEPDEPVFHERWEGRVFGISNFLLPLLDWGTFRKRLIANIAEDERDRTGRAGHWRWRMSSSAAPCWPVANSMIAIKSY